MARKRARPDEFVSRNDDRDEDDDDVEVLDRRQVDPAVHKKSNEKQPMDHLECMGKLRQEGLHC